MYERLSSGQRINRASDDSAGLLVSFGLRIKNAVYQQAIRNVNDVTSLLNVASGATEQLSGLLERMNELAEQAANGTFSIAQRHTLNVESKALINEYNRIVESTTFNRRSVFNVTGGGVSAQLGFGSNVLHTEVGSQLARLVGDGTFTDYGASGGSPSAVGYFNNDGFDDFVSVGSTVDVYLSDGDGTFSQVAGPAIDTGIAVTVGDYNGDGDLDAAVYDSFLGTFSFYLGNGTGSLSASSQIAAGFSTGALYSGDFDNDGDVDIATRVGTSVRIAQNDGTGSFTLLAAISGATDLTGLGDFNGDGNIDIVGSGRILLGNGDNTFTEADAVGGAYSAGDLNGDGYDDLVGVSGGNLFAALSNGDGTFSQLSLGTIASSSNGTRLPLIGDLNGDGLLDIYHATGAASFQVVLQDSNGNFSAQTSVSLASGTAVTQFGDFNGDGVVDLRTSARTLLGDTEQSAGIAHFSISTQEYAQEALDLIEAQRELVGRELGAQGASLSRLQSAASVLINITSEFAAADSRIRDVDVAQETAELVRLQILQQAGAAVLGQANLSFRLVTELLAPPATN